MRPARSLPKSLSGAVLCAVSFGAATVTLRAQPDASLLINAVREGNNAKVISLLKERVDVNVVEGDGATVLHWAVYLDDTDTTTLLIQGGADVNTSNDYGVTPLGLASRNGNAQILRQLLKAGADPNDSRHAVNAGETPLMLAARSGQVEAVTTLLDVETRVNAKETWNGQSALMWATAEGHVSVVRALIAHGADIHARSNSGATALLFAARKGSPGSVRARSGSVRYGPAQTSATSRESPLWATPTCAGSGTGEGAHLPNEKSLQVSKRVF